MRVIVVLYFDLASNHMEYHTCGKNHSVLHLIFVNFIVYKIHRQTLMKHVQN